MELPSELDETPLLDPDEDGPDEDEELAGRLELLAEEDDVPEWLEDDDGAELELDDPERLSLEDELDGGLELLTEPDEPLGIDELPDDGPLELPLLDELPLEELVEPELEPTLELFDELPEQPSQQQQPAGWWNTHAPSERISPPFSSVIVTVRK